MDAILKIILGKHADKETLKAILVGSILSIIVLSNNYLSFYLSPLKVMIHELGHTVFGWLFGYASLPAFNFFNAGGLTLHSKQNYIMVAMVFMLFLGSAMYFRFNKKLLNTILILTFIYACLVFTDVHKTIILFVGHGFEIVFAMIFAYRGLTGEASKGLTERSLYFMLGTYIWVQDIKFFNLLLTNVNALNRYLNVAEGLPVNDFVQIADKYSLLNIQDIIHIFLVICVLAPILVLAFVQRHPLRKRAKDWFF